MGKGQGSRVRFPAICCWTIPTFFDVATNVFADIRLEEYTFISTGK